MTLALLSIASLLFHVFYRDSLQCSYGGDDCQYYLVYLKFIFNDNYWHYLPLLITSLYWLPPFIIF